jgi:Tfp pilus assembly protein PilO
MPEERELGVAFGKVHETANKAQVRITKFDPQAPAVYERLRRVPVVVGCTGSFAQIHEFLRTLEEMPLTIWVESMRMEKDPKTGRDVMCEITLGIFANNSDISGYANNSE